MNGMKTNKRSEIAVEIEKYMRDNATPPNEKDLARLIGKTSDRVVVVPREELVRNLGLELRSRPRGVTDSTDPS